MKKGNKILAEIPVVINVKSSNFLFDVALSVDKRIIGEGEDINVQVDLDQIGSGEGLDVAVTYVIKDFSGNNYFEISETFFVEGEKSYIKSLDSKGLPLGDYIVGLEVVYPGAFATASTKFSVKKIRRILDANSNLIVILVSGVVAVLAVGAITWVVRRTKTPKYTPRRYSRKKVLLPLYELARPAVCERSWRMVIGLFGGSREPVLPLA